MKLSDHHPIELMKKNLLGDVIGRRQLDGVCAAAPTLYGFGVRSVFPVNSEHIGNLGATFGTDWG